MAHRYIKTILKTKSPKVQVQYKQQLGKWCSMIGEITLDQITPSLLSDCRDKLSDEITTRGQLRTNAGVNRYMACLSSVFNIAVREWQWLEENPVRNFNKLKESKGRERFLDEEEIKRLLHQCKRVSDDLYLVVVLSLSTGARKTEIWEIKWSEIDLEKGRAIFRNTKNDETRSVPIQSHALDLLRSRSKQKRTKSDLVFPSKMNSKKAHDFTRAWRKVIRESEIDDFRWHDLRHCTASYLAMNGASVRDIADILGHKTLQMAMKYSHLTKNHSEKILKSMNDKLFKDMN